MEKLALKTPDITAQNVDKVAQLFPNCITESRDWQGKLVRAIDFDQLQQELSPILIDGISESYRLDWPGQKRCVVKANEPTTKTLRPCREESVNFDETKNIFIEGNNLDALKLIQESYLSGIDLIYIDPPYNTGSDLLYNDYFAEDKEAFQELTGQRDDEGNRLMSNMASYGRFHSDWLSMLYPRLRLARNLLRDTGLILVSIDDHELPNATKLCELAFGPQNYVATLVWEKGRKNDARLFSVGHEYILVFAKSLAALKAAKTLWREEKPGAREIWEKFVELRSRFGEDYKTIEIGLQKWFAELPKSHPSKKWSRYKRVDKNGPWRDRDISWPGGDGPRYEVLHDKTELPCKIPEPGWRFATPEEMQRQIKLGLVEFREDHTEPPFRKAHIRPIPEELEDEPLDDEAEEAQTEDEFATQVRGSYFYKQSQVAVKYLRKLMGAKVFDNPKDHFELARLFDYVTNSKADARVLDFFAGSASTAQAVMQLNRQDGGRRQFILVQLPEVLDPSKKSQKAAAKFCEQMGKPGTIAEIAKERIRRAGKEAAQSSADIGFRVLKIDTSNMNDVYYAPDVATQENLLGQVDNIRPDRTPEDLLFQLLIDWGLDLSLRIGEEIIAGKKVYFIDGNVLAACFDTEISEELVKELAKRKPLRAVFRDASYKSDSVKINADQIFKLLSPQTEVRSI